MSGQKLGHQDKSDEILVHTLEARLANQFEWNLVRMFVFTVSSQSSNISHQG